jgi:hypothetical protein
MPCRGSASLGKSPWRRDAGKSIAMRLQTVFLINSGCLVRSNHRDFGATTPWPKTGRAFSIRQNPITVVVALCFRQFRTEAKYRENAFSRRGRGEPISLPDQRRATRLKSGNQTNETPPRAAFLTKNSFKKSRLYRAND